MCLVIHVSSNICCEKVVSLFAKQVQVFRQEIQKKEYYIRRITETKYPKVTLPKEKLDVLVTKWQVVKQKVTVLEERLWEVGRIVKKDSKLCKLLLFLHEAESLLCCDMNNNDVPPHFLLKQHEVHKVMVTRQCKMHIDKRRI